MGISLSLITQNFFNKNWPYKNENKFIFKIIKLSEKLQPIKVYRSDYQTPLLITTLPSSLSSLSLAFQTRSHQHHPGVALLPLHYAGGGDSGGAMPLLEVSLSLSRLYQLFLSFDGAFVGIGVGLLALKSFSQSRFHFAAAKKICRAPSIPLSNLRSRFPDGRDSELVVVSGRVRPKGEKGKGSSVLVSHLFWDSKAVVVERTRTVLYIYGEQYSLF